MVETATLFIVPTPIGNLDDMSSRAIETLKSVSWIAAEDTRHTQRLLQHFSINTRSLSLHEHNESKRTAMLCQRLKEGESIALVSDAGTPLISDPGFVLVRRCREEGINIVALPGPCAFVTALSASGLATDKFMFEGFLPPKTGARKQVLAPLKDREFTTVYYEAPRRIFDTVSDVCDTLGQDRRIVIGKELTKAFETYVDGTAADVLTWLAADPVRQKGEFVLMISGVKGEEKPVPAEAMDLLIMLQAALPLKKAAAIVAEHYSLKKNTLYQAGLEHKDSN
ncbi:16S rRNA (cytidine(1402)-2'-O)-methyltransferase [Alteromonas sp. C1M14]|uniref:16S rRNA (cytidine(1402)-2'-O)-methyltransferase n=1 Tax=Alteromonas sp. C1M14 TaxID=2841567 RepID=UPI001C08C0F1|nr:16S rRNA (cytidine(1402)-2'-O)-methyltransferase [Alteromonas sp. C1M14]MBU2979475.1 16S rRNA (cytidine(1402)-2'-O)-methyltransferase [Alteromonas sp. C1M14]